MNSDLHSFFAPIFANIQWQNSALSFTAVNASVHLAVEGKRASCRPQLAHFTRVMTGWQINSFPITLISRKEDFFYWDTSYFSSSALLPNTPQSQTRTESRARIPFFQKHTGTHSCGLGQLFSESNNAPPPRLFVVIFCQVS